MCHVRLRREGTNELRIADIELFDARGSIVVRLEGAKLKRAPRKALLRELTERPADWLYEVAWERTELAGDRRQALAGTWLVFTDGGRIGEELARTLRSSGGTVVEVRPGPGYRTFANGRIEIDAARPDDFDRLVREQSVRGCVFLWGLTLSAVGPGSDEGAITGEQATRVAGSLLLLTQALVRTTADHRTPGGHPRLWVVTQGAQAVGPEQVGLKELGNVMQAPLWGLGRTIANEHEELWGGLIDLDPAGAGAEPGEAAPRIVAELAGPECGVAVGFRDRRRFESRLRRASLPRGPAVVCRPDATYIIVGGLGAIGSALASWMAQRGAKHLALIGRTGGERANAIRAALEHQGVRVRIGLGDISRNEDLATVLRQVTEGMPPVRGVVHAAGVVDDAPVAQQTLGRLQRVFAPKVEGAINLHRLLAGSQLEFCIFLSSVSALYGVSGQSTYAAANALLDALAAFLKARSLPALSINFGPWEGAGMAADLTEQLHHRWGLRSFSPDQGLQAIERLLGAPGGQIAAMRADWVQFAHGRPSPALARFASAFIDDRQAPTGNGEPSTADDVAARCRTAIPEVRREILTTVVVNAINEILGREDNAISSAIDDRLDELGIDSMLSIDLVRHLQHMLRMTLPKTLVFERQTVNAIAAYLADQLGASCEEAA